MNENRITIPLPERFTFEARSAFRAAYRGKPVPPDGYSVEFSRTNFIDSAGLGMLLQLRDYAGERDRVRFVHLRPNLRELLRVAEFEGLVRFE
jgi:HptB-dependent secretion and biofilm anti anti-sigma factor